jgi:hypothetical protein
VIDVPDSVVAELPVEDAETSVVLADGETDEVSRASEASEAVTSGVCDVETSPVVSLFSGEDPG